MSMNTNPSIEMENAANAYLKLLDNDEIDRLTSMARQEQETQIFWESENIQLNRQKQMGIRETFDFAPPKQSKFNTTNNNVQFSDGHVTPSQSGHVLVGKSEKVVRVQRNIYQGDRLVKKFHSDCDCSVCLLKAEVKNEKEAICPSCGATGTIASYIDGCDYCGSRFTVKDFHAKVTGFSLIENVRQMASSMSKKIYFGYIIMFLVIWSICFFGGMLSMVLTMSSAYFPNSFSGHFLFYNSFMDFAMSKGFFTLFKAFGIMFFSVIILGIIAKRQTPFTSTEMVANVIPNFNEVEFRQDLEHRIKTAMMSSSPAEAMAYSEMDLTDFCAAHRDVFDMSIAKLAFTSVQFDPQYNNYVIGVDVTVKLYRMANGRVHEGYECLHMVVSQYAGIKNNQSTSILEYKCPNCASGINIFHGCTCEYCGTTMNKYWLGPVIHQCTWNAVFNVYRNLPIIFFIVVGIILIL